MRKHDLIRLLNSNRLARRDLLKALAVVTAGSCTTPLWAGQKDKLLPAKAVTSGPKSHFFGYYDKCPWDLSGRYLLAMEIDFYDRQPKPGEALTVGMVDLTNGNTFIPLDQTLAWNWQQGTMLQWLGTAPDREIIYNSIQDNQYISLIRDVHSGSTRELPRAVYAVSRDGRQAVTLDFERVNHRRPGYGYICIPDKHRTHPAPKDAGIYWMDLKSGKSKQIFDLAWVAQNRPDERFKGTLHWFNHLYFNPSGTRFLFMHRWGKEQANTDPNAPPTYSNWWTRLYTSNPDGSEVRLVSDAGLISHFDWRDDHTILAWTKTKEKGEHFYLIDEATGRHEVVGEGILTQDGHCSYSPDRKWILDDTYLDEEYKQTLMLFYPADKKRIDIGRLYQPPKIRNKPSRCDLHPRWNRDGTQVCIDSTHEGNRQMYVIDVSLYTRTF